MRRIWAFVLSTGACGFSPHVAPDTTKDSSTPADDAKVFLDADFQDAPPPNTSCFGTLGIDRVCFASSDLPTGPLSYSTDVTFNTDDAVRCTTAALVSNQAACVIAATSFTISGGGRIHVTGSKPAVFVATTGSFKIDAGGILDASTYGFTTGTGTLVGADSLATACAGATEPTHKGGGYGGSFLALGGSGGKGDDDATSVGIAPTALTATSLHGGCPGGIGEHSDKPIAIGGGAIALIAATLQIDGSVIASGNAGQASTQNNAGGNSGGAGGMVVLDAITTFKGNGAIEARGGGGGQGRGGNAAGDGSPGYNVATPIADSKGGYVATSTGGAGGDGAPRTGEDNLGGTGSDAVASTTAGGGGGGGASGVILRSLVTPNGSLTFTPPVSN